MNAPLVSIVTVNYDHPEVTCALLDSLRKITYPNIELWVVDNASPNDDPSIIEERFPEVQLLRSPINLGFAGGNNLAVKQAKGDYILFINNDTEVEASFLEPLVEAFLADSNIGAISPKIKYFDKPDTLQFTGQAPMNPWTMRSHGYGWGQVDAGQFDTDRKTNFVHGAAMMVPKKVIQQVGMMAEVYFLYYEELDWGSRIREAGFDLWYNHLSVVYHKESISTGKLSPLKTYYMNRSRWLYLRRNIDGATFWFALLFQVLISIPKNTLIFGLKRQWKHLSSYWKALFWHLNHWNDASIHAQPVL